MSDLAEMMGFVDLTVYKCPECQFIFMLSDPGTQVECICCNYTWHHASNILTVLAIPVQSEADVAISILANMVQTLLHKHAPVNIPPGRIKIDGIPLP